MNKWIDNQDQKCQEKKNMYLRKIPIQGYLHNLQDIWHKSKVCCHMEVANMPKFYHWKNPDMSINAAARESGNKDQVNTGKKIIRRNAIIEKLTIMKISFLQEEQFPKIICKTFHKGSNLRKNIYCKKVKPKLWQQDIYRGFRCHVTHGKLGIKYEKSKGRYNTSHHRR